MSAPPQQQQQQMIPGQPPIPGLPAPVVEYQADRSAIPMNALEYLRVKLVQLTRSLTILYTIVHKPNLPSWPSLHSQFNIVLKQLVSLSETLSQYRDMLVRSVAYPLPTYPVISQDNTLKALLRKKPTPEVEDWMNSGRTLAKKSEEESGMKIHQDEEFSAFAATTVTQEIRQHMWNGFLTKAQVSRGETDRGLKLKSTSNGDQNSNNGQQPGGPLRDVRAQKPNAPGQPQHAGLPRPEMRVYEDGGWPVERVITYMSIGPLPQ